MALGKGRGSVVRTCFWSSHRFSTSVCLDCFGRIKQAAGSPLSQYNGSKNLPALVANTVRYAQLEIRVVGIKRQLWSDRTIQIWYFCGSRGLLPFAFCGDRRNGSWRPRGFRKHIGRRAAEHPDVVGYGLSGPGEYCPFLGKGEVVWVSSEH